MKEKNPIQLTLDCTTIEWATIHYCKKSPRCFTHYHTRNQESEETENFSIDDSVSFQCQAVIVWKIRFQGRLHFRSAEEIMTPNGGSIANKLRVALHTSSTVSLSLSLSLSLSFYSRKSNLSILNLS
jgi:hypothetical protein